MAAPAHATASILVASDSAGDAEQVKRLLDIEFDRVFISAAPNRTAEDFDHRQPDVLVLAFNALEKSERYYLGLFRQSGAIHLQPHRTVILCNKDEVPRAYRLCCDGFFDDYVLFWPMTHDTLRLPMAVHHALRELGALRDDGPTPADFAAQARHLATLESLLDRQLTQGRQCIEEASYAVEQAEGGVGAALDEFCRRLTQGELPDVAEVRNADGLASEIARIKEGEVRQRLHAVAGSVRPLTQWADEFRQACEPHLKSVRSLGALAERAQPTILVVDDDEFQHKIVSTILKDDHYHLVFATGGAEALSLLRKMYPDLILMDVMMPDMDGLEVTRQIKSTPRLADIPVVMITGESKKNIVLNSLKIGVAGFLVKPFDRDTLRNTIANTLHLA